MTDKLSTGGPAPAPGCTTPDASAEKARVAALHRYDILDSPREEAFDRITRMAQAVFRAPMAAITLIDSDRQWVKSMQGMDSVTAPPTGPAFCAMTVERGGAFVIEDALADETFRQNSFVSGELGVRSYAGAPLMTPDGHAIGALCVMDHEPRAFGEHELAVLCDLASLVMDELELRLAASTDGLTGALSRRAFREQAGAAIARARREAAPLALILFDLDHFKAVNDAFGYAAGDDVLVRAVDACRRDLRPYDLVGRLGGEEFSTLLPNADRAMAGEIAERLRRAIGETAFQAVGRAFHVTVSLGVAVLGPEPEDLDALLGKAAAALNAAKAGGRDRYVIAA